VEVDLSGMKRLKKDDGRYSGKVLEAYVYYVLDGRNEREVSLLTGLGIREVEELARLGDWVEERSSARNLVGCNGVEYLKRRGLVMGVGLIEGAAKVCGEVIRRVSEGEVEVNGVRDLERVGRLMRDVASVGRECLGLSGVRSDVVGSGGVGKFDNVVGIDRSAIERVRGELSEGKRGGGSGGGGVK